MNKISIFQLKGKEIQMLYNKGQLAYSFEHEGNNYGIAVKMPSKSVLDIASITFQLLTNALETIENLNDDKRFCFRAKKARPQA